MTKLKKFLGKLSNGQKVTIIVAVLGGCCAIGASIIGLAAPAVNFLLDNSARQSSLATPTFLPSTDAVELPANQLDVLSIVVYPRSNDFFKGIITKNIDPQKTPWITITEKDVILLGSVSPVVEPIDVIVLLTGRAADEEVQVTNKIPIRVTYEPISETTNLFRYDSGLPGGGGFASFLSVIVSDKSEEVWAEYSSEILWQYEWYLQNQEYSDTILPKELEDALSANKTDLPDFFLLKNKEKISIPVYVIFDEPGIYTLQFGVEYIYRQYKGITWVDSTIQVYVPNKASRWVCNNSDWEEPESECRAE